LLSNDIIKLSFKNEAEIYMKNKSLILLVTAAAALSFLFGCSKNGQANSSAVSNSAAAVSENTSSKYTSSKYTSSKYTSSKNASSVKAFADPEKDPLYVKAYTNYAANKYDTAIKYCDEGITKDANCFWGYNVKGISLYFQNGNSYADKCLELINKSLQINPDYSYGYFNRALIEKGTKKWKNSISDFEKVLSYNDKDTWSYYGIATVYADTDDKDNTIKYLKLAQSIDKEGVRQQMNDDMQRHFSRIKTDSRFKALLE
jgi:tetratricopeptide (TPR) repeat protein